METRVCKRNMKSHHLLNYLKPKIRLMDEILHHFTPPTIIKFEGFQISEAFKLWVLYLIKVQNLKAFKLWELYLIK